MGYNKLCWLFRGGGGMQRIARACRTRGASGINFQVGGELSSNHNLLFFVCVSFNFLAWGTSLYNIITRLVCGCLSLSRCVFGWQTSGWHCTLWPHYFWQLIVVTTPTTTQHNLNVNTAVGLDMKMTVQTPPTTTHHRNSKSAFRSPRWTFIDHNLIRCDQ